ncbi:MAG TPA: TetR/AcrR family transcriptional regulator [Oscillospiraceae bacterium]|nr:TetR/AcrR family transcriptional regulator [Oscillospiraceae bacterium]
MAQKQPKEFRIENILVAAIDEFIKKGYDGASIDTIAAKAGVSKGGFYYHFTNKEHLLMEVNNKLNEPVLELMKKALSNSDSVVGFKQFVVDYLSYWMKRPKELSFLFLSMSKALESIMLSDYYKQYVDNSTQFFVCMLKKIRGFECTDMKSLELSAISLMGSLDGVISYAIVHPELDIEILANQIVEIWINKCK